MEDLGYIRPVTDGESPVCVQPVTGSHLFGSRLRRVLGLTAAAHAFPRPVMDYTFSCRLVWWNMVSSGVDLLPGTSMGLGLDLGGGGGGVIKSGVYS